MKFKFSKQGVWYEYQGDTILRRWPWVKSPARFYSQLYSKDFNSFIEYWKMVGADEEVIRSANKDRLNGYDSSEVLAQWSAWKYPNEYVLILTNIDLESKGPAFWNKVPKNKAALLSKDVVVLRCSDEKEMICLFDSISEEFADVVGFLNGTEILF